MILGYTAWAFFWMMLASAAAFVMVVYGKKRPDAPVFWAGVLMAIYPYFVKDAIWIFLIGAIIGTVFGFGRKWQWF